MAASQSDYRDDDEHNDCARNDQVILDPSQRRIRENKREKIEQSGDNCVNRQMPIELIYHPVDSLTCIQF